MVSLEDFALIAELALGLTGFAGVAAAFGGREREFTPIDRVRLAAVFQTSAGPMVGSLLLIALVRSSTVSDSVAVSIVAVSSIAYILATLGPASIRALKLARRDNSADPRAVAMTLVAGSVQLSLYASAALGFAGSSAVVGGYAIQLVVGVWMFWRLLTRPG